MPLYDLQGENGSLVGSQTIGMYPVYQGFISPAYVSGIQVPLETQQSVFYNYWPNLVQQFNVVATGDGGATYSFTLPIAPNATAPTNPPYNSLVRGHINTSGIIATGINQDPPLVSDLNEAIPVTSVDSAVYISSIDSTGNLVEVRDSGQFLNTDANLGLLMAPGKAPLGNTALAGGYDATTNVINYLTGQVYVTFPTAIPVGNQINAEVRFFQSGIPRSILFYDNVLTLRAVPAEQYVVEIDAYLSPAAFLRSTNALPFGYMSEYIARGAARKILSDTGDIEQFNFYEPLFREQELLVWKRSQRQFTNNRTQTIYSQPRYSGGNNFMGGNY